ncbi:LANO_0F08944g1_1 [Lachancea nothofagi CBS 11611]|uniref:Xaa-Pro aminopeptidase n=1 Tax=Lachancea nothofagi CBS 11611 TaxID=1266666 RepID=A0A1G4K9M1_9SACH|nr:LANO_0F08944g1_1 [Lachancea nothofagi CBS 11611]
MTTRQSTLNLKNSRTSMNTIGKVPTSGTPQGRSGRPCANCTCSPGLMSRQNRKSSLLLRHLENSRKRPSLDKTGSTGSSRDSVYSSDTICQAKNINTSERLLMLRKKMAAHELCCYIVPSEDEHQNEYVSLADQRRAFISGFTGSAGVACITRDLLNFNSDHPEGKSLLSTDGRYFNQATQELDFNWSLLRQGEDTMTWPEWCIQEAIDMSEALGGQEAKIGIDPKLVSYDTAQTIQKMIIDKIENTKANVTLVPVTENLIDRIWGKIEPVPVRDSNDLLLMDSNYTNETFKQKRERALKYLLEKLPGCKTFCVATLDEICWLLNLRGSDIAYNPVFYAYLLLKGDETILFTDDPYDDKIKEYLEINNVTVQPYHEIWDYLSSTASAYSQSSESVAISSGSSWEIVRTLKGTHFKEIQSPLELFKAVKNEVEISNARAAQVKDAVCLVQYFAWLENQLVSKDALVDEYKAATKLLEIRKTQRNFMGNSFETISSTGSNAAIIHYSPPEENSAMIDPSRIYLCDSGSQFMEGTTDITRTLHFTKPTKEEIHNYTLVLKGNLALERLVFPEGTSGYNIDVIARQFLWQHGLDYRHGTGHGVGSFLNVHEGPIGIGFRPHLQSFALKSGNIITNEPGFYKDGEYGIRIENDMLVEKARGLKFGERHFLKFKNLTLVPYCRKLINEKMLTSEEKTQINAYHKHIWDSIVPFTQPQSISYKWLKRETANL